MSKLTAVKVNALPNGASRTADTMYFVKSADPEYFDIYLTSIDNATVRRTITKSDIATLISDALVNTLSKEAGIATPRTLQNVFNADVLYRSWRQAIELFASGYNLQAGQDIAVISGATGSNLLDLLDTSTIILNQDYLLSDGVTTSIVTPTSIVSSTRIQLAGNLTQNWTNSAILTGSTLVANSSGGANAAIGAQWISKKINLGNDTGARTVVVRRTANTGVVRLYFKDSFTTSWTEVTRSIRVTGTDINGVPTNYYDDKYLVALRGDGYLRIVTETASMTVKHIAALAFDHASVADFLGDDGALAAFQAAVDSTPTTGTQFIRVPTGTYAGNLSTLTLGSRKVVWQEDHGVTYSGTPPLGIRSLASSFDCASVKDVAGLTGTVTGQPLYVASYYAYSATLVRPKGGGYFIWDATRAKSEHNGVTIFSPTVPWDGTQANLAAYLAKTGETNAGGTTGCWVRQYQNLDLYMGGGVDGFQTTFDNAIVMEACLAIDTGKNTNDTYVSSVFWLNSTVDSTQDNRHLIGNGFGSYLYRTLDYGDTFYIRGNAGTPVRNFTFKNMIVVSAGLTTSGAHFHLEGIQHLVLEEIYVQNGFILFQIQGCDGYINRIYTNTSNLYGGTVTGRKYFEFGDAVGYPHPSCADLFLTDINPRSSSSLAGHTVEIGIDILSADGIWFSGGHSGYATVATLRFNPTGSSLLNLVFFTNFMFDENSGVATLFDGLTTGVYADIYFNNCTWKAGQYGVTGIKTAAGCNVFSVHINGGSVKQYQQHGIELNSTDARDFYFNNLEVASNSKAASNTYSGYKFADNTRDIYINGGSSGGGDSRATNPNTQKYGIEAGTGHTNVYARNTDLRKNLTGATNVTPGGGFYLINCNTVDGLNYTNVPQVVDVSSSTAALRVTQAGTGDVALFEDAANPDSTPVVIKNDGKLIVGHTVGVADGNNTIRTMQIFGGAGMGEFIAVFSNDVAPAELHLGKSRGASNGVHAALSNGDSIGRIQFDASDGVRFWPAAVITALADGAYATDATPGRLAISTTPAGSNVYVVRFTIDSKGFVKITGCFGLGAPVTKTANFTVADTENYLIIDKAAAPCTSTLPNAGTYSGRILRFKTIQNQSVVSATANVIPLKGGAASATILNPIAGAWADIVANGTAWEIVAAGYDNHDLIEW